MCKSMEEMRNEASRAKAVQIARRMLDSGKLTYEEIAEFSDLTIEEVKTLDEKQPAQNGKLMARHNQNLLFIKGRTLEYSEVLSF